MNFAPSSLNPEQKQAVEATEGKVLILAGAGTGKTRVLTLRIAYLIEQLAVPPSQILGLTFTNKAAFEMRERIKALIQPKAAKEVTLCTFHSLSMAILRKEAHHLGYTRQFTLYNERDLERLIKEIVRDLLEHEQELPSIQGVLQRVQWAKNRGLAPQELTSPEDHFIKTVYSRLLQSMRAHNAVDFDHLLWLTLELFQAHPEILERYRKTYRYIMIDEYQDTNPIQYKIASLLAAPADNLCVVGDDDQSIYGWRGAEIKNILHFDSARVIKLEQNYRSAPNILEAANAVIRHNSTRHPKSLWSAETESIPIRIFHCPGGEQEAEAVAWRIAELKANKGLDWSEIAILYRSNALSRPFEMALREASWKRGEEWVRGIPYEVFGGVEFYERREIKDLLAFLRLILNPLDQQALLRIVNVPRRGLGDKTLSRLTEYNRGRNLPLWSLFSDPSPLKSSLSERALQAIGSFTSLIERARTNFSSLPLAEAMRRFLEESHYREAIEEEVKSEKMRAFKWENVEAFVDSLAEWDRRGEEGGLAGFLSAASLDPEESGFAERQKKGDCVQLMTFHSAKGLEFSACFLVCLEDHLIPHEKSLKETGLEEERRLMYVALTRAKKHLILSMSQKRMSMGREQACRPSRFLFDIPKELLASEQWDFLP